MTPTEQDKELRDILSKVLIDGQNQVHDLKDGKATPEQITERMFASLDYWQPKLMQLITADRKKHELQARIDELEKQNSHYSMKGGFVLLYEEDGNNVYLGDRITELKQELEKL